MRASEISLTSRPSAVAGRAQGWRRPLATFRVIAVCCATGSAAAQSLVLTAVGTPDAGVGASFAVCGDIDGDGYWDMIAGNPAAAFGDELAILFSGKDGAILHVFHTPTPTIYFGVALAGGSDVTGDGVPDILIGANLGSSDNPYPGSQENGSVFVYSGADKSLVREHVGQAGMNLGSEVAFLDDFDGDGVPDYAASAAHERYVSSGPPEAGEVLIWSGCSGQLVYLKTADTPGDGFGGAIQAIGDVDQDGVSDYCIGARGSSTSSLSANGAVYVYSGVNGAAIRIDEGTHSAEFYGQALARIGDVDADGAADYVTSSWNPTNRAKVVSGASGVVLSTIESPLLGPYFPSDDVDTIEDWDGDGLPEVILRDLGKADSHLLVANALTRQPLYFVMDDIGQKGYFPGLVGVLNDIDGDGRSEIAVGNSSDNPNGAVYEISVKPLVAFGAEIGVGGGSVIPFDLNGGVALAGDSYFLIAGVTGSSPGFQIGQVNVPLNFDPVTEVSIALANFPPFLGTFGTFDGLTGKGQAAFDMTSFVLPPQAIGISFTFAYVVKGNVASDHPGWVFASNPVTALIVP